MASAAATATFAYELATPTIGAVVLGLNLGEELSEACQQELRALLAERGVLFFPHQEITVERHVAFATVFGTPRPVRAFFPRHPDHDCIEVLEGQGESIGTDVWHTDLSWQSVPATVTCLHAQVLPPVGGDTLWANMAAAYDGLSPHLKALVEDLEGEHTWEKSIVDYVRKGADGDERYREQRIAHPPVRHRVVQTHPVTKRKLLFVNALFTTALRGLPRDEADAVFRFLIDLPRTPEYQVRFRWEPRSVVVWDNRLVQHYAVTDYAPAHRRLHRITVDDPAAAFRALSP